MQAIRAKGNKSTELKMVALFRQSNITGGLQALAELTGKPWKIYYRENEGFSKIDLGFFNAQGQSMIRGWAQRYARAEIDLLQTVLVRLPF